MITVEHLTKRFAAITDVNDLSFSVEECEIVGFLGPNGAGKTTTLRILTGFLAATSGRVEIDGKDVFENPEAVKRVIGYLPENVPLYPELRVDEYLGYRAQLKSVPMSRRRAAVESAIERCGVGDVRRRIIGQISKGYRQRVGLADSLLADPKILILDEPTIGLDPNQIRQVRGLIQELGRERTVILSSHILPEVEATCSRVLIINQGRIVGQGRPDELRAGAVGGISTIEIEVLDHDDKAERAIAGVAGVREIGQRSEIDSGRFGYAIKADPDPGVRERIFDAAVSSGFKLVEISSKTVSLEEIFVQITTSEDGESDEKGAGSGGCP